MRKNINRVTLLGHLGKDPEVRSTASGKQVVNFSMATKESWKDQAGEWKDKTEWHNIVYWNKLPEGLLKGTAVFVEGKLTSRSWEKDGQKHYRTEVVADAVVLVVAEAKREAGKSEASQAEISDDDIPF